MTDYYVRLVALPLRVEGVTGCFSFFSTRRLLHFMDEFKPDIVHLHEPHAYFVDLKPLFEYFTAHSIPLVYTFHCEFAYTGKCGFANGCTRWQTGCGHCPALREYPKTLFFDFTAQMWREKRAFLLGQNMVVCTPSEWLAARAPAPAAARPEAPPRASPPPRSAHHPHTPQRPRAAD